MSPQANLEKKANSMANKSTDVVVIGSGPAGYVCAIRLAQLGKKVIVVEKGEVGGVCLNVGCIPSKAMIQAGSLMDRIREAAVMGITAKEISLDVAKLVGWKEGVVKKLTGGISYLFKQHKIESVKGEASFVSPREIAVKTANGTETITAAQFVIATGSRPIAIPGFDFGKEVWSSTEALAPASVPKRLLVIGGGYIGLELGIMYAKLGSQVTVVEATGGLLPGTDPDLTAVVARSMKKRKIEAILNAKALGYAKGKGGLKVKVEIEGKAQEIEVDQILSSVGRRPNSENLGLDKAGVKTDAKGFIPVDGQRRTNAANIYAIGDVAGQPMLAHKGSKEGIVAAEAIAGKKTVYDVKAIPAVIFTSPEVAYAGLTEDEAKKAGFDPVVGKFPFAANGRALSMNESEGFTKIVADKKTDQLLGVFMVGPEVTELLGEAILAIEMGATVADLALTVHAHPTLPETLMEAAEAVHGAAIHIYQAK